MHMQMNHPPAEQVISEVERWDPVPADHAGHRSGALFQRTLSGSTREAERTMGYLASIAAELQKPTPSLIFKSDLSADPAAWGDIAKNLDDVTDDDCFVVAHVEVLREARARLAAGQQIDKAEVPSSPLPATPSLLTPKKREWAIKEPYGQNIILKRSGRIWSSSTNDTVKKVNLARVLQHDPGQIASTASYLMQALGYAAQQLRDAGKDDAADPTQEGDVITVQTSVLEKARELVKRERRR